MKLPRQWRLRKGCEKTLSVKPNTIQPDRVMSSATKRPDASCQLRKDTWQKTHNPPTPSLLKFNSTLGSAVTWTNTAFVCEDSLHGDNRNYSVEFCFYFGTCVRCCWLPTFETEVLSSLSLETKSISSRKSRHRFQPTHHIFAAMHAHAHSLTLSLNSTRTLSLALTFMLRAYECAPKTWLRNCSSPEYVCLFESPP